MTSTAFQQMFSKKGLARKVLTTFVGAAFLAGGMGTSAAFAADPSAAPAAPAAQAQAMAGAKIDLNGVNFISMTDPTTVELSFPSNTAFTDDLVWYFGGKKLSDWKVFTAGEGYRKAKESDVPYITMKGEPRYENGKVTASLAFKTIGDKKVSDHVGYYIPLIGNHSFEVRTKNGVTVAKSDPVKLNIFKNYMTAEEVDSFFSLFAADSPSKITKADRYSSVELYGQSTGGLPMRAIIVAKDKKDIDTYLNETKKEMMENPAALKQKIEKGEVDYKVPVMFSSIHPSEQPNQDAIAELARSFATQDRVTFKNSTSTRDISTLRSQDKDASSAYESETKTLDIKKAMDDFFFVFNISENPDGDKTDTRENSIGFDVNRDNINQVLSETKAMGALIAKYNPLVMMDYHGFVSEFLIEPCSPPHDPNYEYDLMVGNLLENAEAMGRAGVANSKYRSYTIPYKAFELNDKESPYRTGWDDAFGGYTPTFALYSGIVASTAEIPQKHQESFKALYNGGMGVIANALENKDKYMTSKLEMYDRGMKKIEKAETEQQFVDENNNVVGRDKAGQEKFFPDYFIIPVDDAHQKSLPAAYEALEYFKRNEIGVSTLEKNMTLNGKFFEKGSYVIDMAQPKRGLINAVLGKGTDHSNWSAMYADVVVNMPVQRGFNTYPYFTSEKLPLKAAESIALPKADVAAASQFLVKNNSVQSIIAVNEALKAGLQVAAVTEGAQAGQFLISGAAAKDMLAGYALDYTAAPEGLKTKPVLNRKVFVQPLTTPGYNDVDAEIKAAMKEMHFTTVAKVEEADIVIDSNGEGVPSIGNKPYIGLGYTALAGIQDAKKLPGFSINEPEDSYEGIFKTVTNKEGDAFGITSSYLPSDYLYSRHGAYIESLPESFTALSTIQKDDAFVSGWWPKHETAYGKTMIAAGQFGADKAPVMLVAADTVSRGHTKSSYRWLSNAIYFMQ